jgi:hypothetical protein
MLIMVMPKWFIFLALPKVCPKILYFVIDKKIQFVKYWLHFVGIPKYYILVMPGAIAKRL